MNQEIHLSGYQARDYSVVDYHMYELGSTGLQFRGPSSFSLQPKEYFSCIGAAQTFGCFCEYPFPELITRSIDVANLNLGYGGAGPEFFNRQSELIRYINDGKFAILQAMSGRSQSNSEFETDGLEYLTRRSDGRKLGANEAYTELIQGSKLIRKLPPLRVSRVLARLLAAPKLKSIIAETRENWLRNQLELIMKIEVPIIFLWFSKRQPDYTEHFRSTGGIFSEFPQLINQAMVDEVKEQCEDYVEVVSRRGSPQPLFDRHTKKPTTVNTKVDRLDLETSGVWTHNAYYPSPEMHEDAASKLIPICKKFSGD
jgi:hypothetical protein